MIEWEKLDNGKWKKKDIYVRGSSHKKRVNPNAPDYFRRLTEKLKKIFIFCNDCKKKYSLADPCIHHLSDSILHRKKYEDYKNKIKKSSDKTQRINNQTL